MKRVPIPYKVGSVLFICVEFPLVSFVVGRWKLFAVQNSISILRGGKVEDFRLFRSVFVTLICILLCGREENVDCLGRYFHEYPS